MEYVAYSSRDLFYHEIVGLCINRSYKTVITETLGNLSDQCLDRQWEITTYPSYNISRYVVKSKILDLVVSMFLD